MNIDKHRAAVDRLVEERAKLLSQVDFMRQMVVTTSEALDRGAVEVVSTCGRLCPSLELLTLTRAVLTEMSLQSDWVDYLHDAVGGVDSD